jgi:hypothetical protein
MQFQKIGYAVMLFGGFTGLHIVSHTIPATAQSDAVFVCMQKYRDLGIDPNLALQECRNQDFTPEQKTCIESRKSDKSILPAQSGPDANGEYLILLPDDGWEGPEWRSHQCRPNESGPKKSNRDADDIFGLKGKSNTWFTSGYCKVPSIKIDHVPESHASAVRECTGVNLSSSSAPAPTPTPAPPPAPAPVSSVAPTVIILPGNGTFGIPGTNMPKGREILPVEGPNYNGWYRYEKPSNVSDDAMKQAGAAFYDSGDACSTTGYCLNFNGKWLSRQSVLKIGN